MNEEDNEKERTKGLRNRPTERITNTNASLACSFSQMQVSCVSLALREKKKSFEKLASGSEEGVGNALLAWRGEHHLTPGFCERGLSPIYTLASHSCGGFHLKLNESMANRAVTDTRSARQSHNADHATHTLL